MASWCIARGVKVYNVKSGQKARQLQDYGDLKHTMLAKSNGEAVCAFVGHPNPSVFLKF